MKKDGQDIRPPKERRRSPRLRVGVPFASPPLRKTVLSVNLAKTGCFLPVKDWGEPGETLTLFMDLPDIGAVPVRSRIVHREGGGTGIEFVSLSPEDMKKYYEFLDLFLNETDLSLKG
jgi:hypothetical protein